MDFSLFENQHWHRQKWFEEKKLFVTMKMGLKCKYQILYNILVTNDTYREKQRNVLLNSVQEWLLGCF